MTYAPNYDVPENASPFVQLPVLTRCASCGTPCDEMELYAIVRDGRAIRDLCQRCANEEGNA